MFTDELEWTQLSRAIAATGHAARRGQPIFFKSLYSYLIAPAWWIHSTAAAYSAIKGLNAVVMCLAALPAYRLARLLPGRAAAAAVAVGTIAIPAMSYATSVVPESLAYLWFTLSAWLAVRALADTRRGTSRPPSCPPRSAPSSVKEFVVLPVSAALAAAALWVLGDRVALVGSPVRRCAASSAWRSSACSSTSSSSSTSSAGLRVSTSAATPCGGRTRCRRARDRARNPVR